MSTFKIHPAIGVARLGDSASDFYLSPEQPGQLPIACDGQGVARVDKNGDEVRVETFRDSAGRIKRQAARFRVFAYDGDADAGREIAIGDTFRFDIQDGADGSVFVDGTVTDVAWTVHLANKKSSWYTFKETAGMHGYAPGHTLRNAAVTQPDARRALIIDPGLQTVSLAAPTAAFAQGANPAYPQQFPPPDIAPDPIDTLGEIRATQQDEHPRLVVLGGFGKTGSTDTPRITAYANNDGWFDDISDGPVSAVIHFTWTEEVTSTDKKGKVTTTTQTNHATSEVEVPAWVVVGYPRYAPEIVDMITMDEAIYDLSVRSFAFEPALFGVAPFDAAANTPATDEAWAMWRMSARYNPDYYPKFYREIWPILQRPNVFGWNFEFDFFEGSDPHNTGTGGNLSEGVLAITPTAEGDPYRQQRQFIYDILRKPGHENQRDSDAYSRTRPGYVPRAMPELCGSNPLSNTSPDKFLRLTDTQLFLLKQWADGRFVNECEEWAEGEPDCKTPFASPPTTGLGIDRGVLGNVVGGAFCPGGELTWIMLNPALYTEPYRIRHASYVPGALSLPKIAATDGSDSSDLARGLEPGDLTKYLALPWQADFTQCTEQDVDITYENWNDLYLSTTGDPAESVIAYNVPWWPAHRPITVFTIEGSQVYWASGIPPNNAGGLRMVTGWKDLGFIKQLTSPANGPGYYQVERNDAALGPPVAPGDLYRGNTKEPEEAS